MEAKAELLGNMKQVRVSKNPQSLSLRLGNILDFWGSFYSKLNTLLSGEQSRTFRDSETGVIIHQANEMTSELLLPPFNWNDCY